MRSGAPVFLRRDAVLEGHAASLAAYGGPSGVRDMGMLDSALARPLNLLSYGEPDRAELAASYAFGIARNHPFVDGNKRASYVATLLFLEANGMVLMGTGEEKIAAWLALAAGELTEEALATWIRQRMKALGRG